jgi:aminopeptidase N
LTCKDWSHAWLNESFASYFEKLYTEYAFGIDEARYDMMQSLNQYLRADEAGLKEPIVSSKFVHEFLQGAPLVYQKGELVLNMLRHLLGDNLWWKAINYYAHRFEFMPVETHDFKRSVEEATGKNLWWFFDQWVYSVGHPQFEVSSTWLDSLKVLRLAVKQVQEVNNRTPVFRTPVDLEFTLPSGKVLQTIQVDSVRQEFTFALETKPLMVIFDKGHYLIKTLKFPKTKSEHLYQLLNDDDVVGRIEALRALKDSTHDDEVLTGLLDVLATDSFSGVRREAAQALSLFPGERVTEGLIRAYRRDKSARVRVAIIRSLSTSKGENVAELLKSALYNDSSYAVVSASLTALPSVDSAEAFDLITSALKTDSFNDVIRHSALVSLKELRDPRALQYAIEYSKFDKPQNLRIAAVGLLSGIGSTNRDIFEHLISLLKDSNTFIRRTAVRLLGKSQNPKALEPLRELQKSEQSALIKSALKRAIDEVESIQKK